MKNNLTLPQHEIQIGLHIFKVALDKNLWRRIAMPANCTLEDLSDQIRWAYGFDNDHLYEFIYSDQSGISRRAFHPFMDDRPHTTEVQVGSLPLRIGESMIYHYDFGDSWQFDVILEQVDLDNDNIKEPTLLEERGEAPEQYPDYDDSWE